MGFLMNYFLSNFYLFCYKYVGNWVDFFLKKKMLMVNSNSSIFYNFDSIEQSLTLNTFLIFLKITFWASNDDLLYQDVFNYFKTFLLNNFYFASLIRLPVKTSCLVTQRGPHVNGRAKRRYGQTRSTKIFVFKIYTFEDYFLIINFLEQNFKTKIYDYNNLLVNNIKVLQKY